MSGQFCYCGKEIIGRKRKYCSDQCRNRIHSGNISAYIESLEPCGDEQEGSLPTLPDDYVGAWLGPDDLRRRNRELAPLGKRICSIHQGAALPLTEEHFPYVGNSQRWFSNKCKACFYAERALHKRKRYQTDPTHAERVRELQRGSYQRLRPKKLQYKHEYTLRKRRASFARILGATA